MYLMVYSIIVDWKYEIIGTMHIKDLIVEYFKFKYQWEIILLSFMNVHVHTDTHKHTYTHTYAHKNTLFHSGFYVFSYLFLFSFLVYRHPHYDQSGGSFLQVKSGLKLLPMCPSSSIGLSTYFMNTLPNSSVCVWVWVRARARRRVTFYIPFNPKKGDFISQSKSTQTPLTIFVQKFLHPHFSSLRKYHKLEALDHRELIYFVPMAENFLL